MTTKPRKKKAKLPTLKQLKKALPVVSAGLSILSSLPFNRHAVNTLRVAAAITGQGAAIPPKDLTAVREALREALLNVETATEENLTERTALALTLARKLLEETDDN